MAVAMRGRCSPLLLLWAACVAVMQAEGATCPNHYNIAQCCDRMVTETLEACLEYAHFGFNEISCASWMAEVSEACYEHCGNCTLIAHPLNEICKFSLGVLGNGRLITDYCRSSTDDFVNYRCPSACYDNPADCAVSPSFVPTEYEYTTDFNKPAPLDFEPNASTCMFVCGAFNTCHCRQRRGTLAEDICLGMTVVNGTMPNRTYEQYSCDWDPLPCRDHIAEGICWPYRWCEPNMCIIKRIKCVSPHQCLDDGVCAPIDGHCYFSNREDGYPCNDEISYTVRDQCISGNCVGETDYCLKYNVTCEPLSECTTGGVCHPHSGRCTYETKPDDTLCDDHRTYTVEDRCQNGLCVGHTIDLCHEMGVTCTAPNECYQAGVCDPRTGKCSEVEAIRQARYPCDDGDPTTHNDTCMDGVCLGFPSLLQFKTLGDGDCADRDGLRMDRYSGDVADEAECEAQCLGDAQCFAYGYAFPLCSIYGTVRVTAPVGRDWAFQRGSQPTAAVIIEQAVKPAPGSRVGVCRLRGDEADVEEEMSKSKIDIKYIFNPYSLSGFFTALLFCFFLRPIGRCIRTCCCGVPREASAVVSAAPPSGFIKPAMEDEDLRLAAASPGMGLPTDLVAVPPFDDPAPTPPAEPAPEVTVQRRAELPGMLHMPADLTVKDVSPERSMLEAPEKGPSAEEPAS